MLGHLNVHQNQKEGGKYIGALPSMAAGAQTGMTCRAFGKATAQCVPLSYIAKLVSYIAIKVDSCPYYLLWDPIQHKRKTSAFLSRWGFCNTSSVLSWYGKLSKKQGTG